MSNRLSMQKAESIFIAVSCIELFMGLLRMCQVTLPFSRYILWIFTLVYAAVAAVKNYSNREKVIFITLLIFGALLYRNTGLNKGIRAVFYLYALKDVDMRKFFKSILVVLVASTLLFAILSQFGVFGTYVIKDIRNYRGFNGFRYCLGYESCNTAMAVAFLVLICEYILFHEKQSWCIYAVITGGGVFTDFLSYRQLHGFYGGGSCYFRIVMRPLPQMGEVDKFYICNVHPIVSYNACHIDFGCLSCGEWFDGQNQLFHFGKDDSVDDVSM